MNCKTNLFMTKKKAFTLIELLIVIAIIGILFIVLVSKVDFATDKAKASGVQTDFRSFQMAFDTVAKENAGFNTFGWDTGDANQNGKRDSYDEGDNGAGGGIAQNGIQDGTEVFTGHKVYAETFTKVFSLKKNGTGSYDREALNRLETAINANLDPKLHITIADDGKITMANGAQDPWKNEYHGYYITNAETDGKDRGAIVLYSNGANGVCGSKHDISGGIVVVSVPNSNKNGKDDYSLVSCYTYLNGYGEVKNMTTGFSNNQSFLSNEPSNTIVIDNNYTILEGNNLTYDLGIIYEARFKIDANISEFDSIKINGTIIDNSNYTVTEGSTVIALNYEYLKSLNTGNYNVEILFKNNKKASTTMTIVGTVAGDPECSHTNSINYGIIKYSDKKHISQEHCPDCDSYDICRVENCDITEEVISYNGSHAIVQTCYSCSTTYDTIEKSCELVNGYCAECNYCTHTDIYYITKDYFESNQHYIESICNVCQGDFRQYYEDCTLVNGHCTECCPDPTSCNCGR